LPHVCPDLGPAVAGMLCMKLILFSCK
jgi:hypothetical protein